MEAAYRIFSVLNNRGLDLAPIDIIKAEVLGSIRRIAGEPKSRAYAKEWSRIENMLGREAFGELFGHIRTIYVKQKQRMTLVKEFQDHVAEYKRPTELIDKVIKPYAEVWEFVRDADFEATELAETINEHLSWLNRVDFKDWVPPALVYFKRFRQQPRLLAEFSKALERLTYFLLVTRVGINERIEAYASLTKEIEPDAFQGNLTELKTLNLSNTQKSEFVCSETRKRPARRRTPSREQLQPGEYYSPLSGDSTGNPGIACASIGYLDDGPTGCHLAPQYSSTFQLSRVKVHRPRERTPPHLASRMPISADPH